jgi:phosphopantothenoylcysteine decarboxylase/phosphopantothenate--cysteine ligase
MLQGKRILLIVSGGIAAYKALELVRRLRERGAEVRAILTKGGAEFITPLSLSALTEDRVYSDLFSLTDEAEMGHIQLSRAADLLVVAPATADILAKMTAGIADDLATTALLATDKPVLVAPAMNVRMWQHAATQENIVRLRERGVHIVGPNEGPMACGEFGPGRMAEVMEIIAAIERRLGTAGALAGRKALVTSGPTHEPIDPVRYIANRSSGRQGHAIAEAFAAAGAETLLVSGPVSLDDPPGVRVIKVESAREMLEACLAALPVDVAVGAAAVADWRVAGVPTQKLKKKAELPKLKLEENPDILAQIARHREARPRLVIGFAAETERVAEQARAKRQRKGCDWILANDVSAESGTFGGADNEITLIDDSGAETWPRLSKHAVARRLVERVARHLASESKR